MWIKLSFLPLSCWTNTALSHICSKIGRPLHTDHMTFTKERVSYVRVLVKIDAAKSLIREVLIKVGNTEWIQTVDYEFEPIYCSNCGKFGHNSGDCEKLGTTGKNFAPQRNFGRSQGETRARIINDSRRNIVARVRDR